MLELQYVFNMKCRCLAVEHYSERTLL